MLDANNKFKDLFCEEATDQLAILSHELLDIEKDPENSERYATLMRAAHTIKGGAATMGYSQMAKLAHALEDIFHLGERKALILDAFTVSTAFKAIDAMRLSLDTIKSENKELDEEETISLLSLLLKKKDDQYTAPLTSKIPSMPQALVSQLPSSVRVDVERLDVLMGLFEEMLMLRLKLDSLLDPAMQIIKTITDQSLKEKLSFLKEFNSISSQFARLLSETQEQLLSIRLVPIEMVFSQFPRMVRDLALREKKIVEFHMEGGEIELDRTVLSGLGGALAHLLRNAIDHGIKEKGTITLSVEHKNDRVHVAVLDDGIGINYDRVKKVAVERGVLTEGESINLSHLEITDLLFHPNMSTNTEVTDISGRGVGLSAVRAFVQEVGGHVSAISPVVNNHGTKFILDLPISLATVKVLIVESSRFTFAFPFSFIVRTITFDKNNITRTAHQEVIEVDGVFVPVLYLNRLLDITFGDMFSRSKTDGKEALAVLIEIEGERFVVVIDRCIGEQELLVKSLPPILSETKGFSGSALLPDGRTILLLDAHGLLEQAFGDILESTETIKSL